MAKTKRVMKKKPQYVTKPMLERILDKRFAEQDARMDAKFVTNDRFEQRLAEKEHRLTAELASHTKAIMEYLATMLGAFEDKYRDLPGRMAAVEAKLSG